MNFEKIRENINNKVYQNNDPYPKSEDYKFVEDEEKSIRWNREEKERISNEYKEAKRKWNENNNEINKKFELNIVSVIISEYKLNMNQAQKIYDYNYSEHHGYGYLEILSYIEEFVDVYKELRDMEI